MRGRDTSSRAGQKHTGKTNATEIQWQIVHKHHMNNLGGRNFFSLKQPSSSCIQSIPDEEPEDLMFVLAARFP
jgi:hypothetical protein